MRGQGNEGGGPQLVTTVTKSSRGPRQAKQVSLGFNNSKGSVAPSQTVRDGPEFQARTQDNKTKSIVLSCYRREVPQGVPRGNRDKIMRGGQKTICKGSSQVVS